MYYSSLRQIISEYLSKKTQDREDKSDNDWWYASSLGLCKRKHYLRRANMAFKDAKDERINLTGELGNAIHDWFGNMLSSMGSVLETEFTLVDEVNRIRGRLDLVVEFTTGKEVIDVKTERPESFFKRAKSSDNKIKNHQKMQLGWYYFMLKAGKYPDLVAARILYIDRGGGCLDEFKIDFDDEFKKKIFDEIDELNMYWKSQTLPPALTLKEDKWQCRYCEYSKYCKKVESNNNLKVKKIK